MYGGSEGIIEFTGLGLVGVKIDDLEDKSISDLEILLYKIKDVIQNRNILSNVQKATQLLPHIVEHVGKKYTPLKLEGYAKTLNEDDEFYYQINECLLEYGIMDNIKVNPINRLAYTMILSAVMIHQMNTIKEQNIKSNTNNKVDEELMKKYNQL